MAVKLSISCARSMVQNDKYGTGISSRCRPQERTLRPTCGVVRALPVKRFVRIRPLLVLVGLDHDGDSGRSTKSAQRLLPLLVVRGSEAGQGSVVTCISKAARVYWALMSEGSSRRARLMQYTAWGSRSCFSANGQRA